jgi:hypothetical protein
MKKSKDKVVIKKQNSIVKEDLQKIREIIKEIEDDGRSDEFKLPVDYKCIFKLSKHLAWKITQLLLPTQWI